MEHKGYYQNSFPVLKGETVTQGHADYCKAEGHAEFRDNGKVSPYCPRCGESFTKQTYVAGWNMPGYLPEMEPTEFNSTLAAWEWLRDEAQHCADECQGEPISAIERRIIAAPDEMPRDGIGSFYVADIVYWVDLGED